ncbi:hypothetical protein J5N97_000099 [Dioscorea zingiberensis]|uniref:Uncharacterized protein n=1 Tax=Dioscorea zingiberensis TaxID=325984 RepID=A0A9D5BSY7_9LILI|nr:hypothetical protein J5N97_000099 [Dioscorea zingiberensis]
MTPVSASSIASISRNRIDQWERRGKRYRSQRDRDYDGGNKNQKRRMNDREDRGGGDEDSRAKVKVVDPFPGAKDRVITIYSYVRDKEEVDVDDEFSSDREPLCAAQDALFKVHSAISNALAAAGDSG